MTATGAIAAQAGEETLHLLRGRAAFWPRTSTLLIADAHLGKAAAFRRAGIPVPQGTTEDNLSKLSTLIGEHQARRVVFLGDLVHDGAARRAANAAFVRWRERHEAVEVVLVRGNHDRRAGKLDPRWKVDVVAEPWIEGGLALCHAPQPVEGRYAIAGHTHPGVRLNGRARETVRLPCFWFTPGYAVMPAFGAFTGLADVEPGPEDRLYVETEDGVMRVPTRP